MDKPAHKIKYGLKKRVSDALRDKPADDSGVRGNRCSSDTPKVDFEAPIAILRLDHPES